MALFTPEEQRRFDEEVNLVLDRFPTEHKGAALLEVLHLVQDILGCVPDEAAELVAARLELPLMRVHEVRSFYTMFRPGKPGDHLLEVCTNVSCRCRGASEIVERICSRFNLRPGGTSADCKVTLKTVECLGSCGTAPMLAHNGEYIEEIDRNSLEDLLDEIERS